MKISCERQKVMHQRSNLAFIIEDITLLCEPYSSNLIVMADSAIMGSGASKAKVKIILRINQ